MIVNSNTLIIFVVLLSGLISCQTQETNNDGKESTEPKFINTSSGLKYQILQKGSGPIVEAGDEVMIRETTRYRDGTILYSNEDAGPLKIKIGAGMVLAGIDEGLRGMKAGEIRELHLTKELAQRTLYPDHISPDSALVIKMIVDEVIKASQE